MEEAKQIVFQGKNYFVVQSTYPTTAHIRLDIVEVKTGLPFMFATADLEHVELDEDEVLIKNYSENQGILKALVAGGIIYRSHAKVEAGFERLNICQIIN